MPADQILTIILWLFAAVVVAWFAFWIVLGIVGTADILTRRHRRR